MHKDLKNVLLSEEDIQNICKEMGAIITEDYKDRPLVCVGILKGSVMFMADLLIHIYQSILWMFQVIMVERNRLGKFKY